jgi:DNA-binding transcriptional LysR family regulator
MRIGVEALSSDLRPSLAAQGLGVTLATEAAIEMSPHCDALQVIAVCDFEPRVRVGSFAGHRRGGWPGRSPA